LATSNNKTRSAIKALGSKSKRPAVGKVRSFKKIGTKPKRSARRPASHAPRGGFKVLFPKLARPHNRFGLGVVVARAVRDGEAPTLMTVRLEEAFAKPGLRPRAALVGRIDPKQASAILSGLAHPDRIRVAAAIMTGSNTHKRLKETLNLAAGPLYHHLRALQMAHLVALASRNFYVLTDCGQTMLLIAACVTRFASDT
jgi:hypothetical protein